MLLFALSGGPAHAAAKDYAVRYDVRFLPVQGMAEVAIETKAGSGRLIELDLAMPPSSYRDVKGDGLVQRDDERVSWQPPPAGGTLRYTVRLDRARGRGHYDSRITKEWAITRGDRLVPPARVRATKNSESSAKLHFELPPGWDDVETPFTRVAGGDFLVTNAGRGFDRPVGWIIAGDLATMRETIAGMRVNIAAPKGERVDHVATFAILRQALPQMQEAFGELPEKLLIVRAGDPMWRGGLSAPGSAWIHADRPLISENGTSPLLHELTHVLTEIRGTGKDDWIGEGIAEFYSLEIGRRAGLISPERFDKAIAAARRAGDKVPALRGGESTRDRTRKAVALFADLDAELRSHGADLDALVRRLMRRDSVTLGELRDDVVALQDEDSRTLRQIR